MNGQWDGIGNAAVIVTPQQITAFSGKTFATDFRKRV
jgi:hypothetical protein